MKRILVTVVLVFMALAVQASDLDRKMMGLVSELAVQYKKSNPDNVSKTAVAVLGFQNKGKESKNNYIGEAVTAVIKNSMKNSLVFYLVERENLSGVMKEIQLSQTGLLEEKDQTKIGAIKGVSCLIIGEVTEAAGNFIVTSQLIDVSTAKILASSKTEIAKKELIKDTEKFAYEFITANGIGFSYSGIAVLADQVKGKYSTAEANENSVGYNAKLTYRLNKNFKLTTFYQNIMFASAEADGKNSTFATAKNMQNLADVSKYHPWIRGIVDTNVIAGIDMMADYTLKPEVTTIGFLPSYVIPFTKRLSLSLGAGIQYSFIQYHQRVANVPHLVEGAVEYRDLNIINDVNAFGLSASSELEFFVLPRLALNLGCAYARNLNIFNSTKAVVNGVTYYKQAESNTAGYGNLINDYFGYDPFKTFSGKDVYVSVDNFIFSFGISFYI